MYNGSADLHSGGEKMNPRWRSGCSWDGFHPFEIYSVGLTTSGCLCSIVPTVQQHETEDWSNACSLPLVGTLQQRRGDLAAPARASGAVYSFRGALACDRTAPVMVSHNQRQTFKKFYINKQEHSTVRVCCSDVTHTLSNCFLLWQGKSTTPWAQFQASVKRSYLFHPTLLFQVVCEKAKLAKKSTEGSAVLEWLPGNNSFIFLNCSQPCWQHETSPERSKVKVYWDK